MNLHPSDILGSHMTVFTWLYWLMDHTPSRLNQHSTQLVELFDILASIGGGYIPDMQNSQYETPIIT